MSTALKASLESAIQRWASKTAEDGEIWLSDTYWGDTMVPRMAEAAYAVMMAAHESQLFAEEQEVD